jgi:hypothetical protein
VATEIDAVVALALLAALTSTVVAYEALRYAEARRQIRHQHAAGG